MCVNGPNILDLSHPSLECNKKPISYYYTFVHDIQDYTLFKLVVTLIELESMHRKKIMLSYRIKMVIMLLLRMYLFVKDLIVKMLSYFTYLLLE